MGWLLAIAMCVAACGRFGFDASEGSDASTSADGDLPDGDSDAMPGNCAPPRKLCDTFDGPSLDPRWISTGNVTIDTSRAHRGPSSLRVHTDALAVGQDGIASITESTVMPQGDQTMFVRAWIQIDQVPLNNVSVISALQAVNNYQIGVFIVPAGLSVYTQFEERFRETGAPPPLSTWLCLQWTFVRSQTNTGSLALAGDAGLAMLTDVQTEGMSGLVDFELGLGFAGISVGVPQPPMDIWFDDLVVSTAPVSCAE